jgi:hypothetical protein
VVFERAIGILRDDMGQVKKAGAIDRPTGAGGRGLLAYNLLQHLRSLSETEWRLRLSLLILPGAKSLQQLPDLAVSQWL